MAASDVCLEMDNQRIEATTMEFIRDAVAFLVVACMAAVFFGGVAYFAQFTA